MVTQNAPHEFMPPFIHQRHKPPAKLERPRDLIVACPPMRSNVNLSRIVRMAGCCAVERVIACGTAKLQQKIARDGADSVRLEIHRTLAPVLKQLRGEGFQIVGLEQTSHSESLHEFRFERRSVLVIGHERNGLDEELLGLMDRVAEIPVWGLPYSYNAATAACLAVYEYCRQFPAG